MGILEAILRRAKAEVVGRRHGKATHSSDALDFPLILLQQLGCNLNRSYTMSQPLKDLQKPSTKTLAEREAEQVKGGGGIIIHKGSTNRG